MKKHNISGFKHLSALRALIHGDVDATRKTRKIFSHDASLFELKPEVVVYPRDTADVEALVRYVAERKKGDKSLSLTGRSGGTDMSGGAINDSIIVGFNRYFNKIGQVHERSLSAQPGVYYHDFEPVTLQAGLIMPSYPASREICMIGGMVNNNAGGEKTLTYGKVQNYVTQTKIVLRDGHEHTIVPLSGSELRAKIAKKDFEGDIYRKVYDLLKHNYGLIQAHRPKVSKNSTGYNIFDAWDGKTLDLNQLVVGSQGTLGMLTEATFRLVHHKPLSGMCVVFMPSMDNLGQIINDILPLKPSSFESFDEHTLKFAFRFFFTFRKTLGWKKFTILGLSFIPLLNKMLRYLPHLPKMILLVEFEGDEQAEIDEKIGEVIERLHKYDVEVQPAKDREHEEKFWLMRRESFNLLRKNVRKRHTAPFIDDLVVPPKHLPEFLPQLTNILERYELLYTVAGHVGDGNFHIIPLMDLTQKVERDKIEACLREVTELVLKYEGSLSGEHNDGLVRGPFLGLMYPPEIMAIFHEIKHIFDPDGIFNPHKKVDATWEYSQAHIRKSFDQ